MFVDRPAVHATLEAAVCLLIGH